MKTSCQGPICEAAASSGKDSREVWGSQKALLIGTWKSISARSQGRGNSVQGGHSVAGQSTLKLGFPCACHAGAGPGCRGGQPGRANPLPPAAGRDVVGAERSVPAAAVMPPQPRQLVSLRDACPGGPEAQSKGSRESLLLGSHTVLSRGGGVLCLLIANLFYNTHSQNDCVISEHPSPKPLTY